MHPTTEFHLARLALAHYPRSNRYDPRWVLEHRMGPNVLWLAEALVSHLDLRSGMRVLDLGCGKAISSIFLAKEFGVRVCAADLWIDPGDNWRRIRDAGVEDLVVPVHAEAHALRFADAYFDAVVSLDAYHYFGTADTYASYIARFIRDDGVLGFVVPGVTAELDAPPEHLVSFWDHEFWSFHSPASWSQLLTRSGVFEVELADMVPDGWKEWLLWDEVTHELESRGELARLFDVSSGHDPVVRGIEMHRADHGRTLGFSRLIARRSVR